MLHFCAVTVSSTGPRELFKEMTTATSGVLARFPCSSLSGTLVSYGASAVTRTSGRGHAAEAKTNVIEVSGVSIRISKETLLPLLYSPSVFSIQSLNVHFVTV